MRTSLARDVTGEATRVVNGVVTGVPLFGFLATDGEVLFCTENRILT